MRPASTFDVKEFSLANMFGLEAAYTLAVHQTFKAALEGTPAELHLEKDHELRLRRDFTLKVPGHEPFSIECKFESYADTLYPEVAQLVRHNNGQRFIEPGWVYKTDAHYMLYVSIVTGRAYLMPRHRVLAVQVLLLRDILTQSTNFDCPAALNATINGPSGGVGAVPRVGLGLGLLIENIIEAYKQKFGTDGLFCFDLAPGLKDLRQCLLEKSPLPVLKGVSQRALEGATNLLVSQKSNRTLLPETPISELPEAISSSKVVLEDGLSTESLGPLCYPFFVRSLALRTYTRQGVSMAREAEGTYLTAGKFSELNNQSFFVKAPVVGNTCGTHAGQPVSRWKLHHRTPAQLATILKGAPDAKSLSWDYLDKVARLAEQPAPAFC